MDLAGPRARAGQPGWNPLAVKRLPSGLREARVEAIVDSFASALGWDERNNRALNLTSEAVGALAELASELPDDLAPTIFQIPTLLSNAEWQKAVLPHLSPARREFFSERFPRLSPEAVTPVTNLIDRIRSSTQLAALLGAQANSYDIARAIERGQIVLACPGSGGARERLLANLLVYDLLHAAKARAHLPVEQRRPFYVFLDEIQTYDGGSNGTLAELLEQTAKYGIRAFLLNQNPERLTPETLNALTTNRSHLITTALNSHAAGLIAREWGGEPPAGAIASLARFSFLAQVTHHGQLTRPFLFRGLPLEEQLADAYKPEEMPSVQQAIDETSGRRDASETLAALDTLDQRIKDHLDKASPKPTDEAAPPKGAADDALKPWEGSLEA